MRRLARFSPLDSSTIRRFESSHPSQPVRGPFWTHRLRFIPGTWVTLWPCPVIADHPRSRPPATALWGARVRAASLPPSYTITWDVTRYDGALRERLGSRRRWTRG